MAGGLGPDNVAEAIEQCHAGEGNLADPSYAIGGSIQGKDGVTIDGGHAGTVQ